MKSHRSASGGNARLKINPIRGRRPSLMNCTIGELQIDHSYQRAIDNGASRTLILKIGKDC